jgi:hypothetical protein
MRKESVELYRGQRRKEKRELFKRFRHRAIEDVYRARFFALFEHRCFKCGAVERTHKIVGQPPILCIDHHVPMAQGGHLEPGNLVALCRRCNEDKLDQPPDQFYTIAELERLRPLLDQQKTILEFTFDWDAWSADRAEYLRSLGVEAGLVQELLHNPDHPNFIGTQSNTIGVTISVDDEGNVVVR